MVTLTAIKGLGKAGTATIIQTNRPAIDLCKNLVRTLILRSQRPAKQTFTPERRTIVRGAMLPIAT
jgi:hypothetical protein